MGKRKGVGGNKRLEWTLLKEDREKQCGKKKSGKGHQEKEWRKKREE